MGEKAVPDGFPTVERWNMCCFHFYSGSVSLELGIEQAPIFPIVQTLLPGGRKSGSRLGPFIVSKHLSKSIICNFIPYKKNFMASWLGSLAMSKTSREPADGENEQSLEQRLFMRMGIE